MKKSILFLTTISLFLLTSCSSDDDNNEIIVPTLSNGDIIISEIMSNPKAVPDSDGEWFEIYNTSSENTYNLENVTLSNGNSDFTIDISINIEPNSYLVFSNNNDANTNGGINVDFEYDDFSLSNSGGQISIINNNIVIDIVNYQSFTLEAGKSLNLDPDNFNSTDNDNSTSWCSSINELISGDFGTPKAMNTNCD